MAEINQYRQELRDKIIAYAMQEFFKRGVKAVKMDEISQGLHVSKRTVYEIFGDKEELLLAGMAAEEEKMKKEVEEFAKTHAHNVIDVIGFVYRQQIRRNEQVGVVFYEEIHKMPRIVSYLQKSHGDERSDRERFYRAGVEEGLFRKDVNFEVVIEMMHLCMEEVMHRQVYKQFSMQELYDNFFFLMIRGFCTERGLALLNEAMADAVSPVS